jgi:SNF2 family DNA or RNA helicase
VTDLFPYQETGAAWLAKVGRGLLADEMGLGKSAQAIVAAQRLNPAPTVAVVCPASLRENWYREFERFWDGLPSYDLHVESYDKVARGELGDREYDVLILDEAHYLKNHKAKRTQAILGRKCDGKGGLVARAKHVFALTGTPTPNNPSELWPLARALFPEAIWNLKTERPMAYWTFTERYCVVRDTGFGLKIIKGRNVAELRERLGPHVLRRRKEEVLQDLPPIRFEMLPVEGKLTLPPDGKVDAALVADILEAKGVDGLAEIAPHVASLRRLTGLAKVGPVIEWVKEWLEGGGQKLVLFAHHRDVILALEEGLGAGVASVTGATTPLLRQEAIDDFQNDPGCRVFIGQLQAAGTGLTLTAASDLLFVETSWVPAENQQAAMRIHRIGQRNACLVRVASLAGSIDEDIQEALKRKLTDIRKLFD